MTFTSCNRKTTETENQLLVETWDTPFGVPPFDRISTGDFAPALEQGMSLHNEQIDAIVTSKERPTFDNVIAAYDNSGRILSRAWTIFGMLNAADTNEEMQAVAARMSPLMTAHYDAIMMNDALFAKVREVYDGRMSAGLTAEQLRLTEKTYDGFVRAGALLSAEQKQRLKQINSRLSELSVTFAENLLAENNAYTLEVAVDSLVGLPPTVRDAALDAGEAHGRKGRYIFTLDKPSMIPFLTYAKNRALRREIYEAYLTRCNHDDDHDNKAVVSEMARLRSEKARLLGYDSYAAYVTADEMAGTPEAVYAVLNEIWTPALERARAEVERMEPLLRRDEGSEATLEPWDWWYYAEKVREAEYDISESKVRDYLSLDNVKGGIFFLANRLYGITFRPVTVPLYNEECEAYEVLDTDDTTLGILYFDFHPRSGKQGGAWCGTFTEPLYDSEGRRQGPAVSVVCNFTPPSGRTPALLSLDETQTLFHEFGHALHCLFSEVRYRGLSEVEGDFVELPSQIMENWALSPELLRQYAVNYRTGEVMPEEMIERIERSRLFNTGFTTTELVAAALSDMDIHSLTDGEVGDVNDFEREALTVKRGLIPQIAPRYRYPYFSHIFDGGYASGYYFYIWAEVLDKDAFQAFVESGDLLSRDVAERFRREILSRGGSRSGMDMYRAFRGADPDDKALLRARGFIEDVPSAGTDTLRLDVGVVDTRAQARARAERSRRERAEARAADSLARLREADSLAALGLTAEDEAERGNE